VTEHALPETAGLLRHVRACNNATLPGGRRPVRLGRARIGWVQPAVARRLLALGADEDGEAVVLAGPDALSEAAGALALDGFYRPRGEAFDVRATPGGPALARLDRGALPSFGALAWGVHVNGLVRRADGLHLWVARRAANKPLDPGKLDHLAAGGVAAGMTVEETLAKEAAEEAGLPAALAAGARRVATISYAMDRPEGLRRDVLACYDLELPEGFQPRPVDGEVVGFELWPVGAALERVRRTDAFKFNVNLVLIDLFLRLGMVPEAEAAAVRAALGATPP
jgi:8-oxo-dGTP pyrophosphatase MutT (NUDIX family)